MDFDAALQAHADWKVNLRIALDAKTAVDAERAGSDCQCALGRWLHGEAKAAMQGERAYHHCVEAHRDFHQAAGEIAQAINRRDYDRASQLLDSGSRFSQASLQVAVAVRRMRNVVPA